MAGHTLIDAETFYRKHGHDGGIRAVLLAVEMAVRQVECAVDAAVGMVDMLATTGVVLMGVELARADVRHACIEWFSKPNKPSVLLLAFPSSANCVYICTFGCPPKLLLEKGTICFAVWFVLSLVHIAEHQKGSQGARLTTTFSNIYGCGTGNN
jgi:hypothetical protein